MTYADFIMEATDFNSLVDRLEQLVGCPPSPFRRQCGDKTYTCRDCWENFLSQEFGAVFLPFFITV
jgi:hypothetical protein